MANTSAISYNNSDGPIGQNNASGIGHSVFEEPATSPSSSVASFIASQFGKKHDDLKTMLDSSKDAQKLDAMKRIVGMMASGKDVSELFPGVVKNVVSKNIEIKKLVYVYLVRYAEEQQDLALLSIATFQRGLKDPNQLIRASALRVLSSIRVTVIVPIMMLALKEAVSDMSPYVRKTAANAIPKLYCLDPEQKDHLIEIIEKLLQDKTTLVAGSTVIAFEEVCPERIDLIHRNYRKLCNMLIDIDEWGQVAVINMLVRYARTQFLDPNKVPMKEEEKDAPFYPSSGSDESDSDDGGKEKEGYTVDPDHRLLLRSCLPLLKSRNAAVVMAVAKIYHHIAPSNEVSCVVKALVRLLRGHREVQAIVLSNIITMSLERKGLFEPYIRTFFVHASDPTLIKKLKLDILTNLATESNIPLILREFQTYVLSADKDFTAATIQAIGRCASNIPEVGDTCLAGLIRMLSNRDENVVGESIIVIKKLLQMHQKDHRDVITHMAKLLDKVKVPMARASIIWLIGEYADRIPKIAPDVLRKMAKTFSSEEDIVKLQVLTLGAKLYVINSKQTRTLCQYILQLAKYDMNYDIRDRGRFLKFMLFPPGEGGNSLKKKAKKIFLVEKPAPILESLFKDRGQYQLGSLSHMIDAKANGYQELPDFPEEQPDTSVRDVELEPVWGNQFLLTKEQNNSTKEEDQGSFYSNSDDDEESSEEESGSEEEGCEKDDKEEEDEEDEEESEEESEVESSGEESEFEELSDSEKGKSSSEEETNNNFTVVAGNKKVSDEEETEEESEEDSEEESSSEESDSESDTPPEPVKKPEKETKRTTKPSKSTKITESFEPDQSSYDQLLDLDDFTSATPVASVNGNPSNNDLIPSLLGDMESLSMDPKSFTNIAQPTLNANTKVYELLNKINGKCLTADYRFTRSPCVFSRTMIGVEILFKNLGNQEIKKINVGKKTLAPGSSMQEFSEIESLAAGESHSASIGIDNKDTIQPVKFEICTETDKFPVSIKVPVGELIAGISLTENEFTEKKKKLTGMTETSLKFDLSNALVGNIHGITEKVLEYCSMNKSPSPEASSDNTVLRFGANLVSSGLPVFLTITLTNDGKDSTVCVNCEKISLTSILAKDIKTLLSK